MRSKGFMRSLMIFALIFTVVAGPGSSRLMAASAGSFVEAIGGKVLAAARAGSVSQFRSVLGRHAALSTIANYSLGPYRKKMPSGMKQQYYRLVSKHISQVFARHSGKLRGTGLTVLSEREKGRSAIVKTRIKGGSGTVTWRLIKAGSSYKVFDVNVQGVWLAGIQKTDFVSVLRKNNGDFNALIAYLKK